MILSKPLARVGYLVAALIVLLSIPALQSCGVYTFSGAQTGQAKTISIAFIQNKASLVSPTLSQMFTEKLKDKFIRETKDGERGY